MAGHYLDAVRKRCQALQRPEQILRSLARLDREVRPCRIADEQRVAGEGDLAVDEEGAVLGAVPGRVQHLDPHRADIDDLPVLQRFEGEGRLCERMDCHWEPMFEREPAVSRDVVGVGVRLEHAFDADARLGGGRKHGFDLERRVDDDCDGRLLIPDQVTGAAQIIVDELP